MDESREIFLNAVRSVFAANDDFITALEDEAKNTMFEGLVSKGILEDYLVGMIKLRDDLVKAQVPEEELAVHDALTVRVKALLPNATN